MVPSSNVIFKCNQIIFLSRMRLVRVPVDPVTQKADVNAMKKAITCNTCMVTSNHESCSFICAEYLFALVAHSFGSWLSSRCHGSHFWNSRTRPKIRYPRARRCMSRRFRHSLYGRSWFHDTTFRFSRWWSHQHIRRHPQGSVNSVTIYTPYSKIILSQR